MGSLQARVAELDDYAWELGRELRKLELERAHNALSVDEEVDFLGDLREAVDRRRLQPWRRRVRAGLVATLAALLALALLPEGVPRREALQLGLAVAVGASLVVTAACLAALLRSRRRLKRWLGSLEAALASGRSIFDVP